MTNSMLYSKKLPDDGHRITGNSIAGLTFAGGELPV